MQVEQAVELSRHTRRIRFRQVRPGLRVEHAQAHDLYAGHREGELAFVVGVSGIEQHHGVARIQQRAEQVVSELRAPHADGDVLGADSWHAEEVFFKSRDLLAAFHVTECRGVATTLVEEVRVFDDGRVGLPEFVRGRMVHPSTAEGDHLCRVQSHRQDVLPLCHFHDLADGRRLGDLLAHERGQVRLGCGVHGSQNHTPAMAAAGG